MFNLSSKCLLNSALKYLAIFSLFAILIWSKSAVLAQKATVEREQNPSFSSSSSSFKSQKILDDYFFSENSDLFINDQDNYFDYSDYSTYPDQTYSYSDGQNSLPSANLLCPNGQCEVISADDFLRSNSSSSSSLTAILLPSGKLVCSNNTCADVNPYLNTQSIALTIANLVLFIGTSVSLFAIPIGIIVSIIMAIMKKKKWWIGLLVAGICVVVLIILALLFTFLQLYLNLNAQFLP